ncbi:MFS transporter [Dictyobacter formicarum]|uniref:ABC transporter permease n=1 Tax=Dictyobacter formicarum TaxID=2778368 RepID=A0ABQ3VG92_9CHLR|nr:MFS transporter [Dictyobacter formicarum]GHO84741.1 ABC transporter permease [Dictyobacter formicarum]
MNTEDEAARVDPGTDHKPGEATGKRHQRDARLIVLMRGLRSFSYGLIAVLLSVALSQAGFSPAEIGLLITVSLIGDFVGTYLIALVADRWGRRRTLSILALLMAATGLIFGLVNLYAILLAAAFFGTLGTSASETAPFLPIEQAMLPQTCAPRQRTALFAHYNLVATFAGALGALAAGLPDLLTHVAIPSATGIRLCFGIYALAALIVAMFASRLSVVVEAPQRAIVQKETMWQHVLPQLGQQRRRVFLLSGLFSIDALSGGLVVQSLFVLFFHLRFGVPLSLLAVLFFAANLFSALSFLAAAPLARRIGLLNTMVFTHLPSNLLLALVALMPTFPLAATLLLLRQMLSQMDVPTRQAYTMALVAPEARTATASVTSLARSGGSAISPVVSGLLLQGPGLALGLPLMLAGAIKIGYDLSLWAIFRHVPVEDTQEASIDPTAHMDASSKKKGNA